MRAAEVGPCRESDHVERRQESVGDLGFAPRKLFPTPMQEMWECTLEFQSISCWEAKRKGLGKAVCELKMTIL